MFFKEKERFRLHKATVLPIFGQQRLEQRISSIYSDGMFSGAVGIADVTALINLLLGDD
jgi:hypothetical protein